MGWDAVTGTGTPNYGKLAAIVVNLVTTVPELVSEHLAIFHFFWVLDFRVGGLGPFPMDSQRDFIHNADIGASRAYGRLHYGGCGCCKHSKNLRRCLSYTCTFAYLVIFTVKALCKSWSYLFSEIYSSE